MEMREECPKDSEDERIEAICRMMNLPEANRAYYDELVNGVYKHYDRIDQAIALASSNWKLSRMSPVDRNIIRIAAYEMLYRNDIPPQVAINEAIEIGKKFGTEHSASFINGILDNVYKHFKGAADEIETDFSQPG